MDRRQCLGAMLLAAAATIAPAAWAQDSYPSRLVKVFVGFPAGSATDVAARGIDTRTLQAFMGHRSISNTVVYTAVADKRIRNIWGKS